MNPRTITVTVGVGLLVAVLAVPSPGWAAAPSGSPAPAPADVAVAPAETSPAGMLDALPVMAEFTAGYERAAFPSLTTKVRGCTLRDRTIIAAARPAKGKKRVRVADCRARDAQWRPEYVRTKRAVRTWGAMGTDLLIPPQEAWQSGAFGWTPEQRAALVLDLANRRTHFVSTKKVVGARKNREPQAWLPADRCTYAIDWLAIKYAWRMAVDDAERDALAEVLAGCGTRTTAPVKGVAPRTDVPTADVAPSTELVGRVIGPEMFGFNLAPRAGLPTVPYGVMRLWDASTSWADLQPERGRFDWRVLDAAVADATRTGVKVVLVLGGTPGWAAAMPGPDAATTASSPPANAADFDAYVGAVVDRYAGRIYAYQVWNEANLSTYWRGGPEAMVDLTARVHQIVKARDPGALVVAASTTIRLTSALGAFYPTYLSGLAARGWPVDALSVHSYPASTGRSKERDEGLALFRVIVRNSGAPALPVWETEINFGLAGPGPTFPDQDFDSETQQTLVVRAYLDSLRNSLASTAWYQWQWQEMDLLGVQMLGGSAASQAYGALYGALVGSVFTGCDEDGLLVTCSFTAASGAPFRVVWVTEGTATVQVAPQSSACRFAGACLPGAQVSVGEAPLILR